MILVCELDHCTKHPQKKWWSLFIKRKIDQVQGQLFCEDSSVEDSCGKEEIWLSTNLCGTFESEQQKIEQQL